MNQVLTFINTGGIRPPMHPAPLRCSSVKYSRYSPSSRLAGRGGRLGALGASP
jgi:hypothetical protein